MYHYTACGLDGIYLKNGYTRTDSPSGTGIAIHDIDGLHKAIAWELINKAAPLAPAEFRFLRLEMDLSQRVLGKWMDKSDQIIAKWEKGTQAIPVLADKAIRDMYADAMNEHPTPGLLQRLAELDREIHALTIALEETEAGWEADLLHDAA